MRKELPKTYDPQEVEGKIYQAWMDAGCFRAAPNPDKKPFSIVMPPPNVTGQLHMGHAMDSTLQDILTRFKRMQGYEALWMPGTDHAGIATQIKVEEELRKNEGLTRHDLGRENSWSGSGTGRTSMAAALWSSRKSWGPPATGSAPDLPWTRAVPRPSGRPSASCTARG